MQMKRKSAKKPESKKFPRNIQVPNNQKLNNDLEFIMKNSGHTSKTDIIRNAVNRYRRLYESDNSTNTIRLAQ